MRPKPRHSSTNESGPGWSSSLGFDIDQVLLKVVDTPGFGDSDGADNELIEEMMDVLDNTLGYTNIILLVIEGGTPRFDDPLRAMLRQMTSIFGESWWDFTMIGGIGE